MEIRIHRQLKLKRVAELRTCHEHTGGSFVVYFSCMSMIFISCTTPKLVWVSPRQSRQWKGIVHSVSSLLLGWWSIGGIFSTLQTLAHNLLGGFDLTNT